MKLTAAVLVFLDSRKQMFNGQKAEVEIAKLPILLYMYGGPLVHRFESLENWCENNGVKKNV